LVNDDVFWHRCHGIFVTEGLTGYLLKVRIDGLPL